MVAGVGLEVRANRTVSALRAVGGKLVLQGDRLEFRPHGLDQVVFAREWSAPLTRIRSVGVEARGFNPFNGALRKRLRVEMDDGSVELFVVPRLDEVRDQIATAAALAR
jgi:hypothetical protein